MCRVTYGKTVSSQIFLKQGLIKTKVLGYFYQADRPHVGAPSIYFNTLWLYCKVNLNSYQNWNW